MIRWDDRNLRIIRIDANNTRIWRMKIRVYEGIKREFQREMDSKGMLILGGGEDRVHQCRHVWELSHRPVVYVLVSSTCVR